MKQRSALLHLLCRICGHEDRNCVSVFSKEGINQSIQKKIRTCLTISVEETDLLPKQICFACLNKLDTAYDLLLLSKEGKIIINQKLNNAPGHCNQDSNLCGVCNQLVEEDQLGVGCEGQCQRWFHITCANVNRLQYQSFIENPSKIWMCHNCKHSKPTQEILNSYQNTLMNSIDIKLSSLKENAPIKFGETALITLAPSNSPPPSKEGAPGDPSSIMGVLQPAAVMVSSASTDTFSALHTPTPSVAYSNPPKQEVYPQSLIEVNAAGNGKPVVYQLNNDRRQRPSQPQRSRVTLPKPIPASPRTTPIPAKRRALREGDNNIPQPKKSNQMCKFCNKSFPDDIIDHHVNLHFRKSFHSCLDCNKNFSSEDAMSRHRCRSGTSETSTSTKAGSGPINLTEDSDDEPILV